MYNCNKCVSQLCFFFCSFHLTLYRKYSGRYGICSDMGIIQAVTGNIQAVSKMYTIEICFAFDKCEIRTFKSGWKFQTLVSNYSGVNFFRSSLVKLVA